MILHLNGLPGVGKLTIARIVAEQLGGRLLDSHTIYNVAFSLTEFQSPEFYALVRLVRNAAYDRAVTIPNHVPIIMTNAFGMSDWGRENWDEILKLAQRRASLLLAVTLTCSSNELRRRMATPERAYLRKLTNPNLLRFGSDRLMEDSADKLLRLDTTTMTAVQCAERIIEWTQHTTPTKFALT